MGRVGKIDPSLRNGDRRQDGNSTLGGIGYNVK